MTCLIGAIGAMGATYTFPQLLTEDAVAGGAAPVGGTARLGSSQAVSRRFSRRERVSFVFTIVGLFP